MAALAVGVVATAYATQALAVAEASDVNVANPTPGRAFGAGGTQSNQFRTALEVGLQF